nr:MAG TPA: hypothetical protein [Caudoviricetes sp.]
MDVTTLGIALALMKSMPDSAISEAIGAANRAEALAESIKNSADQIAMFEALGLTIQDGKICCKVEKE